MISPNAIAPTVESEQTVSVFLPYFQMFSVFMIELQMKGKLRKVSLLLQVILVYLQVSGNRFSLGKLD